MVIRTEVNRLLVADGLCIVFAVTVGASLQIPLASVFVSPLNFQFSSVQSLSRVWFFVTPWIAACQTSLSNTNSRSSLKLMSVESVMPSSQLILRRFLLLLPPIPPSIRVFSNESTRRMRWPKYWSFSFSIIPSKEHPGLISFRMDRLDLCINNTKIQLTEEKQDDFRSLP